MYVFHIYEFSTQTEIESEVNYTDKKKFWIVPFPKRQRVAFSQMKRSILRIERFHFEYDSFQIFNETDFLDNEIFVNAIFHYQKGWFRCRFAKSHIVNENFSFPKRIVSLQKGQIVAFRETERFRIFFFSA